MKRTIRVLLADDEPVILKGLKKIIPWEGLGLEIVGEAEDGRRLLDMLGTSKPDLVISDICMPGLTGIDIIRHIHENGRPVKVIFISAYQDFDYAREAIQYGALDYLVKPVITEQLERVVERAVRMIRQESEGERNREKLIHYERKNHHITLEELLDRLTDGDKGAARLALAQGGFSAGTPTAVCVLETDETAGERPRWEERERKLVEFALSNIIKETAEQVAGTFAFRKGGRFAVLVQGGASGKAAEVMADLHGKINAYLKLNVSIGIGKPAAVFEEAELSYRSALNALKRKYFEGLNAIYEGEGRKPADEEAETYPSGLNRLRSEIEEALKGLDRSRLEPLASDMLHEVRMLAGGSKHQAVSHIYTVILHVRQSLADFGVSAGLPETDGIPLLERLAETPTYEDLRCELERELNVVADVLSSRVGSKETAQLSQVKEYVEKHYAENVTLEAMAALVYMNPYYFSTFFKKHTGQNFKTFVTEVRMRHALRLLQQSDLMIYEIADSVGYNNARHFSDMFKKHYGKLPQEYRSSFKNR